MLFSFTSLHDNVKEWPSAIVPGILSQWKEERIGGQKDM